MLKRIYQPLRIQARQCSTKPQRKLQPEIIIDTTTHETISRNIIKPRKHPGVVHRNTISIPEWFPKAVKIAMEDYPRKDVMKEAERLYEYLIARQPPAEAETVQGKYVEIRESFLERENSEMIDEKVDKRIHSKTVNRLKREFYHWEAVQYDKYRSLMYMLVRAIPDYAAIYRVLSEIHKRDRDFHPKTLLDFGSGIGTVSWVASELWGKSLRERLCIDISTEIDELAQKLAKRAQPDIKGAHFHRQYLPIAPVPTYEIVISAFTLFELPNMTSRMDTIANLWRKTEKYLVLIDLGTKGGFDLINEARDFIIHMTNNQRQKKYEAFIFSPCPHEFECPRKKIDEFPCFYEAPHFKFSFTKQLNPAVQRYSYVVFKKGAVREKDDYWPRINRPVIVRSGHTVCRMCTAEGKLQEIIFSKGKHERTVYYCARNSRWGDRLPIEIINKEESGSEETPESNETS